ncbi:hypothetical protein [Marinilabilia salmonicolor]|uniref:hypothetical protein n=1 Tax=Marinilabilia salmonicolor TaxID=989 RepID=UPI00029ADE78|nr:hypothetical protein [Marinilabilia salmonicolor]
MNFALAAVLFLLLSLPGIAFRRSYYSSRFSISFISTNFVNEIIWALVPSFIFHAIAICFLESFYQEDLKIEYVGYLLSGGTDKTEISVIFKNINNNLSFILLYLISISIVSALSGNIFRWIVRGTGFGHLYSLSEISKQMALPFYR